MQKLAKITQRLLPWVLTALILITVRPAAAQDTSTLRSLAVTGHGHTQAPATLAQITLGLSERADSAKAAYDKLGQRSTAVTKLLTSSEVDDIKTSAINLNPQYGRDGKPEKATYDGYRNVQFRLPVDKMEVLDQALKTGVDRLHSIRYVAAEAAVTTARDQAIEGAIADAQAQANVALDRLGFTIQEIVDIRIDDVRVNNPEIQAVPADESYASGRWSSDLSVAGGEQTVDVAVTLQVRY